MNMEHILQALRETLGLPGLESRHIPIDETVITLPQESILPAVQMLIERFGVTHLSTITGQDTGKEIELLYHFWSDQGLTLRTALDKRTARIDTLTHLIPGASFYEREAAEMLGMTFEGSPQAGPFILPDDWDGPPPLRTDDTRSTDDG